MLLHLAIVLLFLLAAAKGIYVLSLLHALPRTGGALFCTTPPAAIEAILDVVPLRREQTVVDLGCGDGRFLAAVAARFGARGIGYEINLVACCLAQARQWLGRHDFTVERRDFFQVSLAEADLVFCYLFPDVLARLAEKVRREMKPGALLVSRNFPLPGLAPVRVLIGPAGGFDPIYIYRPGEAHET